MVLYTDVIKRSVVAWAIQPNAPRGYLAGIQDPGGAAGDGLTTIAGSLAPCYIEVRVHYGQRVGPIVTTTFSGRDGTWRIDELPSLDLYEVTARDLSGAYDPHVRSFQTPHT